MKKLVVSLVALFVAGITVTNAQGGGGNFPRLTVEERIARVHAKLDSAFKLDAATFTKVDSAFATYYRASDKLREELMASGDRQGMREKMQPLADARDKELKGLLTEDQYKKWKDEIEPAMRPQRGGGGQGRQR
jgi:periplasmic protein CpxP/Spy